MSVIGKSISTGLDAVELRKKFDQTFAEPDLRQDATVEDFLAIRLGARCFAIPVAELIRIDVGRKIVTLPGGDPWLLGLANCQGRLVPVHDLELVLGYENSSAEKRWLLIHGQTNPLGLAFDAIEGYLRVAAANVLVAESSEFLRLAVRGNGGELRPVVNLPSIFATIQRRVSATTT